ncbi:FAD-dependent oxidoreductase [Nocardia concava]
MARPHGRVFFASAERSPHWPIHMEGAAESALATAAEVAARVAETA